MEYKVVLEAFEGPLDLLMHLIEKEKVDIYDIPIAKITDQYIDYIKTMQNIDLDMTSEFLVMAATLLEIKSKMLLPASNREDEQLEMEEIDPREELVKRLIEYKKFKMAAENLKVKGDIQSKVFFKHKEELEEFMEQDSFELEKIDFKELLLAYANILNKSKDDTKEIKLAEIQRDELTIEECMGDLESIIKQKKKIRFDELFNENMTKIKVVVTFLSILELIKLKIIKVVQEQNFGEIIIKSNNSRNEK
ncbi:segregation/condensation protein A [Proteiniborus sp. MB09-C3]|uniref:segregation and condensation protein A n=1 Tax=Proteiniborus sp. MB09-C3 TaxID=3050072 RepID=UPI0025527F6E|nr:segregation/condensation protein A [Proteiniborus sp. MB09-C3]WIV10971.1 segregation/condensation protein A [Proteiniborus sp. MB09-C3]